MWAKRPSSLPTCFRIPSLHFLLHSFLSPLSKRDISEPFWRSFLKCWPLFFPPSRGWSQTQPQLQGGSCLAQISTFKSVLRALHWFYTCMYKHYTLWDKYCNKSTILYNYIIYVYFIFLIYLWSCQALYGIFTYNHSGSLSPGHFILIYIVLLFIQ